MDNDRHFRRPTSLSFSFRLLRRPDLLGLLLGALAGLAAIGAAGSPGGPRGGGDGSPPALAVTHLPPLLTVPGEPVELRYDVACLTLPAGEEDEVCHPAGSVFVRAGAAGPFRELALHEEPGAAGDRFVASVPEALRTSPTGFSYYAVFRAPSGETVTHPAGGARAPQRSVPLDGVRTIDLGTHRFGHTRAAAARVAEASWGSGPGQVGLEQGRNLPPIGGASFDVDRSGAVHVLDEANRRLLRWRPGARTPESIPLAINGTLADLAVDEEGALHVLETVGEGREQPFLRTFGPDGAARGRIAVAEQGVQVRVGPDGPLVLEQPSGQWMPATSGGRPLTTAEQLAGGRAGRQLRGGGEVVVLRHANEVRLALVSPSGARRSWRLTSETPLAEVQLAEPLGDRLVVVVRVYTDERDEFLVAVLDRTGLVERFSLDSADWAETAPLSRFRLLGSSLYQLGSTPEGVFVSRYDLEVR
ncbi:MAG TPA: hypothetical protein VNK94_02485 [Gaiellaceae bacterium]|nr:hypothetical protein [Gaiellaceae bacterium]